MSSFSQSRSDEADRRETAARWTVRRDRGLSAAESIEFELWLAADPRHAAAMQRIGGAWSLLDRIPESVAQQTLAQASCRRSFWRRGLVVGSLAAAAALVVLFRGVWPAASGPNLSAPRTPTTLHAAGPSVVTLADGTTVRLNTGGEIVEQFTQAERRVLLARGEAFFEVTKSPARPFIVRAGRVDVRAVGTAFNVNLTSARVEVIVTEGRVGVAMTEVGGPGAKTTVYEPGLRLPLVVRSPDQKARGVVSKAMISWVDFTPTILDFAGVHGLMAPPLRAGDPEDGGGASGQGCGQEPAGRRS